MIRQENIVWKQLQLDIITRFQLIFKQIPKSVVALRPADMHTNGVIAKNRWNYWANSNDLKNKSLFYCNKQTHNYSQSTTHNLPTDQKNEWPIYQIKIYRVKVNYWNFLSIRSFILYGRGRHTIFMAGQTTERMTSMGCITSLYDTCKPELNAWKEKKLQR